MKKVFVISIFFVALCISLPALGRITLPSVFSDNMVLQQKSDVPIWGWGDPGWMLKSLEVRIVASWALDDTVKTRVNSEGRWKTSLKTPQAGGPYTLKIFTSLNDSIEYKNVMTGEVWLCSGQSNMHWWLSALKNYDAEIVAYGQGMQTLINNWRNRFGKEFPFYQVQIAPFNYNSGEKAALLREQQKLVTKIVPKTGMVVISDLVADVNNIHPIEKLKVGERLANMALAETYGRPLKDYKSPTFKSISIKNGNAVISFYDVYTGLTCSGKEIEGLKIAGADGQYNTYNVNQ
jgi:hypothetical protein